MSDLSKALAYTMDWEGGLVSHPDDPGGRTKFGITERDHPDAWEDGEPTLQDAHRIYRHKYWGPLRCSDIASQRVATYVFDAAVNQGVQWASEALQRACNLLGKDISVDGIIGPVTLSAANTLDADRLIHVLVALRARHRLSLAESRAKYRSFLYGWLRRDYAILEAR